MVAFCSRRSNWCQEQGDDGSNDAVRKDQYKYALGNETPSMPMSTIQTLPKSFVGQCGFAWGLHGISYVPSSMEM